MRTAAILPVKRFAAAKQRLSASVVDELRVELARAMVGDVLAALAQAPSIELTIVVSGEPSLADEARARGALVIDDERERGQSAAASIGISHALASGIERVICIPGDCPTLDPAEIEKLLADEHGPDLGGPAHEVVIVPDRHGTGTNGLLLTPPDAIVPSFGPNSAERHRALARAAGAACRVEHLPSLGLDIDTGADLAALRGAVIANRRGGQEALAVNTRAVLQLRGRSPLLPTSISG